MSLSMTSEAEGKWQYISSKKDKTKGKKEKEVSKKVDRASGYLDPDETLSAFAALDSWQRKQDQAEADPKSASAAVTSNGKGTAEAKGIFTPEEEENLRVGPVSKPKKQAAKQEKPPKVKKTKVAAKDAIAAISSKQLEAYLKELERSYSNHQSQCAMVGDYLLKALAEAELPFDKMICEQPPEKAARVPFEYLPSGTAAVLGRWLSSRESPALSELARSLVVGIVEGLPEAKASKQLPPKPKVGFLVLLSVVLREKPSLMAELAPFFLSRGAEFVAPLRVPYTLWIMRQAAAAGEAGVGAAVHSWCTVFVPQILGLLPAKIRQESAKCTMMQQDAALAAIGFFKEIAMDGDSASSAARAAAAAGLRTPDSMTAPVVPNGTIDTVARGLFGGDLELAEPGSKPKGVPSRAVRESLEELIPALRELSSEGASADGFSAEEELVIALQTAAESKGPFEGPGSRLVAECATSVVTALLASDHAFSTWEEKHKKSIRGSSRVLQNLAAGGGAELEELLAQPEKAARFVALLAALRGRHQLFLEARKGWQGASAVASEAAIFSLEGGASRAVRSHARTGLLPKLSSLALALGSAGMVCAAVYAIAEPDDAKMFAARHFPAASMLLRRWSKVGF
uniref:Uncharacterized protein n=1 Tax=Tetraselmis sp. GSL018 TaxID=582737 RepID=A0A061R9P1_9CHLO